jgi:hypothetical protein
MPSSDSSREALLERLSEEFVERCRRGECPALSEYADRYPDLAAEIRDLFPALVKIEHLKPLAGDLTGAFVSQGDAANSNAPERLGDYRILREVGRGGMGIVYEAEQESLGRHVALKVLPQHSLDNPVHLERFRREARAAGRLHHTNIVPVYGVGEWRAGDDSSPCIITRCSSSRAKAWTRCCAICAGCAISPRRSAPAPRRTPSRPTAASWRRAC